jgi:hypothetical protein
MATFYKYAERSAESQVNWAEIGKDMTDMLRQEVAVREEKKAAIDEATRKLSQEVANAPQGESVSAKEEAIRLADQVTKYMFQQEKLLKSGLLDPKDYMVSRQNLTDGTRQAYQTMKDFQAKYGELMEGVRKGTTSIISVKELEKIQGYGNFRQSGFFIDSPTGKLNVGLKEEQTINGQKVIGLKPGSTVGMQYIQGGIYGVRDVYDYRKDIMELSNSLGEEIRVTIDPATMSKLGSAKTISDLRQRAIKIATEDPTQEKEIFNYLDAMEKAIGGFLVNENNLGSLLADTMGYEWTDNPEDAKKNPNTVLGGVDPNTGQPSLEFTDKNKQDAADFMLQQFLGTIDVKESVQGMGQVTNQSRPKTDSDRKDDENKNVLSNVAKLYYGTDAEVQEASDFLRSFNPAIDTIDRSGSNITITYTDGRPPEIRPWNSESGELLGQEGWVTANTNFFLPEGNRMGNVKELIKRAGIDNKRTFNSESTGFSAGTTQTKEDIPVAFKRIVQENTGLNEATFVLDDETKTVTNLRKVISAMPGLEGYTLEETRPGYDVVDLKDKEGNVVTSFDLNEMDNTIAKSYVNQLLEMSSNNYDIEQQAMYVGKKRNVSEPAPRSSTRTSNQIPR